MAEVPAGLDIPINMSLEEAELALKRLEQMAREAGRRIKNTGDDAGNSFSDSIKKWRKDEKNEGRQVGFLVEQFSAGLIPATGAAREGISLLTKALIGGMGLSLALDAIGSGVRLLSEYFEEEAKKQATAQKSAEEHAQALRNLSAETQAYIRSVTGTTSSLEFLYQKQREFESQHAEEIKRRNELDAQVFDNERQGITTTTKLLEEREALTKRLEAQQKSWNAEVWKQFDERRGWEQAAAAIKAEEEARLEAKKRGEEKLKEMQQAGNRIRLEADREGLTAVQLVWVEFNERKKQILDKDVLAQQAIVSSRNRKLLEIEREHAQKARDLLAAGNAELLAEALKRDEALIKERDEAYAIQATHGDAQKAAELLALQEKYRQLRLIHIENAEKLNALDAKYEQERRRLMTDAGALPSAVAASGSFEKGAALAALEIEERRRRTLIEGWHAEGLLSDRQYEDLKTQIVRDGTEKRIEILMGEASAAKQLQDIAIQGMKSFAQAGVSEFGKVFNSSRAYSNAMRASGRATADSADLSAASFAKMAQSALATIAQESLVKAIFQTAEGLGALAIGDASGAATHFASAGEFAAAAAAAGVGAVLIGQSRGMTRSERMDAAGASSLSGDLGAGTSSISGSSGAREVGGFGGQGAAAGRDLVYVYVGDPFETAAETARRATRALALAKRLQMRA